MDPGLQSFLGAVGVRLTFLCFLIACLGLCSDAPGQAPEALEEAKSEGALDLLDDAATGEAPLDSLGLESGGGISSPGKENGTSKTEPGLFGIRRMSLRWTSQLTGRRLRFSLAGAPGTLRPHLIAQRDAHGEEIRASLDVGPLRLGHREVVWGEGMTVGLGERDPHWMSSFKPPLEPMSSRPWPWLGPVRAPLSAVLEGGLPQGLRAGGLWLRTPSAEARGLWVLRRFETPTDQEGSWIGLLLLKGERDRANVSLAWGRVGEWGWISGEAVVDGRPRAGSVTVLWNGTRSVPSLRRTVLRLRWDREGPWVWSRDPRRPPLGRARLFQLRTSWSFKRRAAIMLETTSETRWSDTAPAPLRREGLIIDLSLHRPRPLRPKLRLVLRRSRKHLWNEGMGREQREQTSRLTMSVRVVSTANATLGLRGGLARVTRGEDPSGPLGSSFWEWHGWRTADPWIVRWTLGGGSGEAIPGRWLGLFPDPSGWIPLPSVAPSLWMGLGLEARRGAGRFGMSGRIGIRNGELRATWILGVGLAGLE